MGWEVAKDGEVRQNNKDHSIPDPVIHKIQR